MALPDCEIVLKEMLKNAQPDNDPAALQKSIDSVDEKIENLEAQSAAIRECVTDKAKADLTAYLNGPKLFEIDNLYPGAYIVYGPTYGTIGYGTGNITDWEYRVDEDFPPPDYSVVYSYTPGADATIDELVGDYDFGNDYLTHPIGVLASYGLEPLADLYDQAKSMLLANKAKIENSVAVLSKYVS